MIRLGLQLSSILLIAVVIGLAGCSMGSHDAVTLTQQDLRSQYVPSIRSVPPPDSLVHLTYTLTDDTVAVHVDPTYKELKMLWAAGYRDVRGGAAFRTLDYQTFATLWSRELALAELFYELGIKDLSPDAAQRIHDERMEDYFDSVRFDVHVFIDERVADAFSQTNLGAPGTTIVLDNGDGTTFTPYRIEVGSPRQFRDSDMIPGVFYRLNTVYFRRHQNGRDILNDASTLRLRITTRLDLTANLLFTWNIDRDE